MITVTTFFSETLNTVDEVIYGFVQDAYQHLIQENMSVITGLLTLYVIFIGYKFLFPKHHFNATMAIRHFIVMLCAYGLIVKWDLYNLFVYNFFTNEPGAIAKILVSASGHFKSGDTIVKTLDGLYEAVFNSSCDLFAQSSLSVNGLLFILYGLLTFIIGISLCVFALLLFIYAKMMMAVSLALGPLFILCLLFEPTKGLFSAWLNKLITLALIPIVTSAILALMLSVVKVTLIGLQPINGLQHFSGLAPFFGLALTTILILSQVLKICSSLGSGITISSLSQGANIGKSILNKSGVTSATKTSVSLLSGVQLECKRSIQ